MEIGNIICDLSKSMGDLYLIVSISENSLKCLKLEPSHIEYFGDKTIIKLDRSKYYLENDIGRRFIIDPSIDFNIEQKNGYIMGSIDDVDYIDYITSVWRKVKLDENFRNLITKNRKSK